MLVSIGLLLFLLTKIKLDDFIRTFQNIAIPALLGFVFFSLAGSVLRAWRYKWLLHPHAIKWKDILMVTFIRNLFVDLLPARIGSLSYIYILNKRLKYSFESSSSTFIIAFLFDFLTLSPILITAIFFVGMGSTALSIPIMVLLSVIFFLIFFLIFWKVIPLSNLVLKIYSSFLKTTQLRKKKWAVLSLEKIKSSIDSLEQIQKRKIYWPVFLLSLFIRMAKYISLFLLLFSLLYSHGLLFDAVNFFKTVLGITGAELSSALPVKGIGGFGTWESAWVLTSRLIDFEDRLAIISGIGIHLISNLFEYALGIISLLILYSPSYSKRRRQ